MPITLLVEMLLFREAAFVKILAGIEPIEKVIHQGGTAPPMSVLSAQRLTFRLLVESGRWRN
ncbi:MAG: hypothetical protein V7L00_32045 [Nostoc sp.]|uniref:hypothetical protein n=1 Tax=Nostoc sp. TaxID=1180 RepID=UPI002FF69BCA